MSLVKTSILNAVAVAIKLGCSLILNKFLAVYVGPAGYAVIGNFQNVFSILVSFSGGVLSAGVTKYTAQFLMTRDSSIEYGVLHYVCPLRLR